MISIPHGTCWDSQPFRSVKGCALASPPSRLSTAEPGMTWMGYPGSNGFSIRWATRPTKLSGTLYYGSNSVDLILKFRPLGFGIESTEWLALGSTRSEVILTATLSKAVLMLIDAIINELKASGLCDILTGAQAKRIIIEGSRTTGVATNEGKLFPATAVISTVAIPNFLKLIPFLGDYSERLMRIDYLNILCVLLQLKNPISNNFWLNINDARIAFNGVVETTNLNPREDLIDSHLAYIPFYLHQTDSRWSFDNNQLYRECISALRLIQPAFDEEWIRNWWIFRDDHAQAVCRVGFMDLMPSHKTPVEGLYITDSSQYYPEDRTVSASVRLGRQVADLVSNRDSKPEEL